MVLKASIDSTVLMSHLPSHLQHMVIDCVSETASTNTDLLNTVKHILPSKSVPILRQAAKQTMGRGRLGRSWSGNENKTLTFSLAWPFAIPLNRLYGLSVSCGIALIQALTADMAAQQAQRLKLKWPNDVLLDGAKLAGILIETVSMPTHHSWAVIGVGINHQYDPQLAELLSRRLAGLDQLRDDLGLTILLARCVTALARQLKLFEEQGLAPLVQQWPHYDAYFEKYVDIYDGVTHIAHGLVKGIDQNGQLLLQTQEGLQTFALGEVSLRSISI